MPNPRNTASRVASEGICEGIHTSKSTERKESDSTRIVKKRVPNATEQRFNRDMLNGGGLFEAITFILPGGSKYKPDWALFQGSVTTKIIGIDWKHFTVSECERAHKENPFLQIKVYEIKGDYAFFSENRALTAFKECRAAFPEVVFQWWTILAKEWVEKHERHGG